MKLYLHIFKKVIFIASLLIYSYSFSQISDPHSKQTSKSEINHKNHTTYKYPIAVLSLEGFSCSFHFEYSNSSNAPLDKKSITELNQILKAKVRSEADKRKLITIIEDFNKIERILKRRVRKYDQKIELKISHIGVKPHIKDYLTKRGVKSAKVEIVDFNNVNY